MFRRIGIALEFMILIAIMFCVPVNIMLTSTAVHAQAQKYSFISKWGSEGVSFGKFNQPLDIAIDSNNNVYVTDTTSAANQIQKFTSNGAFITSWGTLGFGDGRFTSATAIDVDSSDNVYVTDSSSPDTAVQKFTSNGTFVTSWGSIGLSDGQFITPGG